MRAAAPAGALPRRGRQEAARKAPGPSGPCDQPPATTTPAFLGAHVAATQTAQAGQTLAAGAALAKLRALAAQAVFRHAAMLPGLQPDKAPDQVT